MCTLHLLRNPLLLAVSLSAVCLWPTLMPQANAGSIVIDSFNKPDPGTTFFITGIPSVGGSVMFEQLVPEPDVIGGERDILIEVVGTPMPISAAGIIGFEPAYQTGMLQIATFEPGTRVIAQYDGIDIDGDELVDSGNLNGRDLTDGGTNYKIRLKFASLDTGGPDAGPLYLKVTVTGDTVPQTVEKWIDEGEDFCDVAFADFPPNLFEDVDSLTFAFNDPADGPVPNVDFRLDSIEAVPEPSTMVFLFGLGASVLAAFMWQRRKRRNGLAVGETA